MVKDPPANAGDVRDADLIFGCCFSSYIFYDYCFIQSLNILSLMYKIGVKHMGD